MKLELARRSLYTPRVYTKKQLQLPVKAMLIFSDQIRFVAALAPHLFTSSILSRDLLLSFKYAVRTDTILETLRAYSHQASASV